MPQRETLHQMWCALFQEWRDLYALASLLSASLMLQAKPSLPVREGTTTLRLGEAMRVLDLGIMVGCRDGIEMPE